MIFFPAMNKNFFQSQWRFFFPHNLFLLWIFSIYFFPVIYYLPKMKNMKKKMEHGHFTLKSNKCNLPCDDGLLIKLHNNKLFVPLQKGDIIWVATRTAGGLWKGVLSGRTGWFRPSHTEPCSHGNGEGTHRRTPNPRRTPRKTKPRTVEELLYRIGLEVSMFTV